MVCCPLLTIHSTRVFLELCSDVGHGGPPMLCSTRTSVQNYKVPSAYKQEFSKWGKGPLCHTFYSQWCERRKVKVVSASHHTIFQLAPTCMPSHFSTRPSRVNRLQRLLHPYNSVITHSIIRCSCELVLLKGRYKRSLWETEIQGLIFMHVLS